MYQLRVLAALAATFVLYVPTQTRAEIACTSVLMFKEVRFSEPTECSYGNGLEF